MPINRNELTKEQILKAMQCKTADELMALAKAEDLAITKDEVGGAVRCGAGRRYLEKDGGRPVLYGGLPQTHDGRLRLLIYRLNDTAKTE